jgi:two-component system chemotaxis sensor kinase CheA
MDLSKYRQLFLDESREHLQALNRELLVLEKEGEGYAGVDVMFRAAHSVKGMSASMGYDAMAAVSHALEEIMDRLRKKTLAVGPPLMGLLYEGVDTLGALANQIEEKGSTSLAVDGLVARLQGAARGGPSPAPEPPAPAATSAAEAEIPLPGTAAAVVGPPPGPVPAPPEEDRPAVPGGIFTLEPAQLAVVRDYVRSGLVPYACVLRLARDSGALAARNFIVLGRLGKLGMLLASTPTLEEVRAGRGRELVEALLLTERPQEQLRTLLLAIPEVEELQLRLFSLGSEAGPRPTPAGRPAPPAADPAGRAAPKRTATVRVETRVLDDLINIVGELIINRERLLEIGRGLESEELHENLGRLDVLVRQFQDSIMTVRMMPLELVVDRLPRLVRDLAFQCGKQVGFEVAGRGVELDRAILEELNDVLLHLVRNALDHGVEAPAERVAAGKPPKAQIRLRAGRDRDWVWISVEDDGRGMDPGKIAAAAVERGLVTAEQAAQLEPRDQLRLACLPGVSTAAQVTELSGRGVGMDVVKAKLDAFGGALLIDSAPGRGSSFTLRLPLTLAIIRILLVEVRGQEYGLPVSHVQRTGLLEPFQIEWSQKQPLLHWGTRLVPLADLGGLLGHPPRDLRSATGLFVAVTEIGGRAAGIAVDRLLGTYEVVVKPLGLPLKRVRGLSGVTVMGDGRTVLLLDIPALAPGAGPDAGTDAPAPGGAR